MRKRIGSWRVALSIGRVAEVAGVNSEVVGGRHIIMWEFDTTDKDQIVQALQKAQATYNLPSISLARSHPGGGFHAYCFQRLPWLRALTVVAATEGVDPGYESMCAWRQKFTLRLTDKGQGAPQHLEVLASSVPPDCEMADLVSYVRYEAHTTKRIWRFGMRDGY